MKHPVLASKNQSQFLIITILSALLISPTSACAQGDDTIAMLRRIGRTFAAIGEKASPAVVVLKVDMPERSEQRNSGRLRRPEPRGDLWVPPSLRSDESRIIIDDTAALRRLRRLAAARRPQGLGFIVSTEGHILTNHRIVADASKVRAESSRPRSWEPIRR